MESNSYPQPTACSLQPPASAICLVIDRLPAHLVGAYGNTWIRTPALDGLAAESLLIEFATIDSPELAMLYRGYWRGVHAACPADVADTLSPEGNDLPTLLRGRGVRSLLVTDEPELAQLPLTARFDELVRVETDGESVTADSVDTTRMARFFAAAADVIDSAAAPSLVWLHCQSLSGPWDAPLELRNFYADEEDPDPPTTVEPPNYMLAADHDPDERLGISQAAAGQITALDECLEGWLSPIAARLKDTLLIVIGARGLPLGEHLRVGPCDEVLYEELVHVPLMIRPPNSAAPLRTVELAQSADIYATLSEWFGLGCLGHVERRPSSPDTQPQSPFIGRSLLPLTADPQQHLRDRAVGVGPESQWSIRTSAWYLRHSGPDVSSTDARQELFVKPDDRFEQSDVTRRCADIVERLTAAGEDFLRAAKSPASASKPTPLEVDLIAGLD